MGIIDNVYPTGVPVQKSNVIADDKTGKRRNMAAVDDVRNSDLSGQTAGIYVRAIQKFYDLDTGDTTSPDDGDECIIDLAGNRFKKLDLGSGSGASAAYLNVLDFGAVGDGITDDTSAIQDAEDARSLTGQVLVFPAGVYLNSGIVVDRSLGGGWFGYGAKFKPTANSVTFMSLSGATIGITQSTFDIRGFTFSGEGRTGIKAIVEPRPNNTNIIGVTIDRVQYACQFTGDASDSQYGSINIANITQLGTGEWSFKAADDSHYLFGINISNMNVQGLSGDAWSSPASSLLHFKRCVLCNVSGVNAYYLAGTGYGVTLEGDCQGTFFTNLVLGFPSIGINSIADSSGNNPNYVYLTNVGVDTPQVSGLVTTANEFAWKVTNFNVTNGAQKTNTGPAVHLASANYDFCIDGATITNNNQSGIVIETGAKVRLSNIQATANNFSVGGYYDIDLKSSTQANVQLFGKNTATVVHSLVQPVLDNRTGVDSIIVGNGIVVSDNIIEFLKNDTTTAQRIAAGGLTVSNSYSDTPPTNGIYSKGDIKMAGSSSGAGSLRSPAAASSYVWTFPSGTTTLVGRDTTDTLTNKAVSGGTIDGASVGATTAASLRGTTIEGTDATEATSTTAAAGKIAGGLGVAKKLRVGGGIYPGASTFASGEAQMYYDATLGLVITGKAGSGSDFGFYTGGGSVLFQNSSAGSVDLLFAGSPTFKSTTPIPAGGAQQLGIKATSTANFGIFFGSGAPTLSAAKGSLYIRSDGSGTNNRAYINTDGGTAWTAITTVA